MLVGALLGLALSILSAALVVLFARAEQKDSSPCCAQLIHRTVGLFAPPVQEATAWSSTSGSLGCPVCGRPMIRRFFARALQGKRYVSQCPVCGVETGATVYLLTERKLLQSRGVARVSDLDRSMARMLMRVERAEAEQAIGHCRRQIKRQHAEVERLKRIGRDAKQARHQLSTVQQLLAQIEAHKDRLSEELGNG